MKRDNDLLILVLIFAALWYFTSGGGVPSIVAPKASAATFVYEKDSHVVPPAVLAALNKLNRERGIVATIFDEDIVDGTGETPVQYVVPLRAAREAGLPALVVTAGANVVRVVKNPTTEQSVMEAIP